jgi:hypothetical protein
MLEQESCRSILDARMKRITSMQQSHALMLHVATMLNSAIGSFFACHTSPQLVSNLQHCPCHPQRMHRIACSSKRRKVEAILATHMSPPFCCTAGRCYLACYSAPGAVLLAVVALCGIRSGHSHSCHHHCDAYPAAVPPRLSPGLAAATLAAAGPRQHDMHAQLHGLAENNMHAQLHGPAEA